MWYVFPQNDVHSSTPNSKLYSIKSVSETKAYLNDEILGERLREWCTYWTIKISNEKRARCLEVKILYDIVL